MAPTRQVSIRLATDGKAQVVRDFGDLGDAGDASAKRISTAYNRAANDADAALGRLQKAGERMASIAPNGAGATNAINPLTGANYSAAMGAAKSSAAAIAAQMDQADVAAKQLLASVDPLFAAQMRYNQSLERAVELQKLGVLTEQQFAQVQAGLKAQLDGATVGMGNFRAASGTARIAQMELMGAARGMTDALAIGMPVTRAVSMEMGRLTEAAAFMGGGLGKVGEFLAGGWGIALMIGTVALVPMVTKMLEAKSAADDATEKLKKQADQEKINAQADREFAQTLDGVEKGIRDLIKAYDDYENRLKGMPEKELEDAQAKLKVADAAHKAAQETLNQASAQLALNNSLAIGAETKGHADPRLVAADAARAQIAAAQTVLDKSATDLDNARESIVRFQSIITTESSGKTAVDNINKSYDQQIEKTRQLAVQQAARSRAAGDEAKAQTLVTTELKKQIDALNARRQSDIKTAEERDRKGPQNAGGTAIFNDQIAAFFDIASKYRGDSETRDRGALQAFFRAANINLDPEKQAWCAAFVNAVLAAGGVHGTNSQAAGSFLNFGKDDTHSPQRGDIVVIRSNGSPSGMHVGFLDSIDKQGNVSLLAGNTGDKVGEETVGPKQVLAVRRPPTPAEQAEFDDKATQDAQRAALEAIQQQQAFDGQREHLNQQYLQALGKVVVGYDAQAGVQLARAQGEHDAEAQEIASNLAAGKYGDATSQLAQSRAQQLQQANDQVLAERKAAISLESYVKSLQAQDAANEREAQFKVDGLQYQQSIARTAGERKTLGQQIIDVEYKEKEAHLKYLLWLDQLVGNTEDAAKVAAELAHLPEQKARAQDQNNRSNQTPFDAYRDSLPQSFAEVNDGLQKAAVGGLQTFTQGLDDLLMKSKSFGEFWHGLPGLIHSAASQILADMIKLAEEEAILAIIKTVAGGASGGLTYGDLGMAPPQFATGTESFAGGMAWVGEHGPEMVRLPRGSKIHTAADSRRMAAANDMGPGVTVTNYNDFRGADASSVDAINSRVDEMERTLPGKIVATVTDAKQRFALR